MGGSGRPAYVARKELTLDDLFQLVTICNRLKAGCGGIIFLLGMWIWAAFFGFQYPWALAGVTLIAGVSFVDNVHSLPDSVRLVAQFVAYGLMFWSLGVFGLFGKYTPVRDKKI